MNKKELITAIVGASAPSASVTKKQVEAILEGLATVAADQLKTAGELNLPDIGKLVAKDKPARIGRNPRTGESVEVPASKAVKFTVSSVLKKAIA